MNAVVTLTPAALGLRLPAAPPPPPIEALLSASGPAFMGVFASGGDRPDPATLRDHVDRARAFLDSCAAHVDVLRDAVEPVPVDEIGEQIGLFVTAWPNTSNADLRGYGAQLVADVIERRPCRYALPAALRRLRQTSRFLPAIAEVLTALDEAQGRLRNTAWHIERLPAEIEGARAALAAADRRGVAGAVRPAELSSIGDRP